MYYVYVIQNAVGRYYIGLSEDVAVRLTQHNAGTSQWTRGKGPWNLAWKSEGMTLKEARQLELRLKRQKGGKGFYQITGLAPNAAGS